MMLSTFLAALTTFLAVLSTYGVLKACDYCVRLLESKAATNSTSPKRRI
jgi:hypothetical protein